MEGLDRNGWGLMPEGEVGSQGRLSESRGARGDGHIVGSDS